MKFWFNAINYEEIAFKGDMCRWMMEENMAARYGGI